MNSIVLLGRTTSAIELKQTQAGKSVVSFSLAVKRPFTKDTTDFFTVVAWDNQAELLSKYVGKGNQICIRGHLTTRSWTDNNGNKRTATEVLANEVTFCESKKDSESNNTPSYGYNPYASAPSFDKEKEDNDLPF